MRGRGGRPRNNAEMRGSNNWEQILENCNFGIASTDSELADAGAWHARRSLPGGSTIVLRNVFAVLPGRAIFLNHRCVAGAVPPQLGNMNPYGGEGPVTSAACNARRKAATTPPSLGNMNPYGGEGPSSQLAASASAWWINFQ